MAETATAEVKSIEGTEQWWLLYPNLEQLQRQYGWGTLAEMTEYHRILEIVTPRQKEGDCWCFEPLNLKDISEEHLARLNAAQDSDAFNIGDELGPLYQQLNQIEMEETM